MKKIVYILLYACSFLFIWGTDIANRTEADDAFEYAWQVENNGHDWLYHPHHLLYGTITKDLYNGAKLLGYEGRAYPMLRLISALCGAGTILLFFRFCYRRFSMRPISSLLCSGFLLFSYGFWRYANEAEVIVPACFLMLLALYFSVNPGQSHKTAVAAGVLCGISVLFHVLNVIPVFIAVPLFYLLHKNWKGLALHAGAACLVTLAGYAWVYWFESSQIFEGTEAAVSLQWSSLLKSFVGFSQCIVSSNFMLGFESVRDLLVNLFPTRMLSEEIYMGKSLPQGLVVFGAITLLFFVGCFLSAVGYALYLLLRKDVVRRRDRTGAADGWMTLAVTVVWFGGYAGAVLLLEPGNPEVWVMGLVPFWLAFCGLIVAPLSRQNRLWVVLVLVILLVSHNYTGGFRPLQISGGDYNYQKAEWILENAQPNDVILTAGNPVFERYFRYYCPAKVEYLHFWSREQLLHSQHALAELREKYSDGRIFCLGDVFDQPNALKNRFPEETGIVDQFAKKLIPHAYQVHEDVFGGVYRISIDK